MKKGLKITAVIILTLAVLTSLTACSADYTNAEKFAARANVTLSKGIWDFPELEGVTTYNFNSIEYYTSGAARVIRANCVVSKSGNTAPYVFLLSDNENYLNDFISSIEDLWERPRYLEETELFFIYLSDFEFTVDENNSVSILNVQDLTARFNKTGDKSLLGM
jgi:hypothetical protein